MEKQKRASELKFRDYFGTITRDQVLDTIFYVD